MVKRSTLRSLIRLRRSHLLDISVIGMYSAASVARSVGEEKGFRASSIEIVIVESSGMPLRPVSLNGAMKARSCPGWRSLDVQDFKIKVCIVLGRKLFWRRQQRRCEMLYRGRW